MRIARQVTPFTNPVLSPNEMFQIIVRGPNKGVVSLFCPMFRSSPDHFGVVALQRFRRSETKTRSETAIVRSPEHS